MKKLLLMAALAVFGLTTTNAQEVRLGAKAGVNFASVGGDETDGVDGRTSFHVGGLVEIPISEVFSVQPELLYSSQGAKTEDSFNGENFESKTKLDYINIPILAKFYVADGFSIEAGPQIGFLVSANQEFEGGGESEEDDVSEFYSGIDLGIGAGASYRLTNGVFFSARYVLGLSNIIDDDEDIELEDSDDFKRQNNVIQLSVGYSF
ncbi:porin family protein [Marixanthomonas ophiurae]|uniref:PorT family protein n=1 Tax=Marixanthomonas ophiurae TaxID=387659 RepID=A0A3E1Q7E3_9FLAO|nr:porin family protein [Marixanthomonas ophiurae]RFN58057.1 PorT family protein [Marixanthomonas ophiurae]